MAGLEVETRSLGLAEAAGSWCFLRSVRTEEEQHHTIAWYWDQVHFSPKAGAPF